MFCNPVLVKGQDDCNKYPCFANVDLEEMSTLPLLQIQVDFHFIESGGNNFQCSNPSGDYYAPTYALQILNAANDVLSNPAQSNQTTAPDLPDTRLIFVLFDESSLCNSVFVHEDEPTAFVNDNVLHILIKDSGTCEGRGMACTGDLCDYVYLYNAHCKVFDEEATDVEFLGGILCHEFGHTTGLCHSHDENSTCPELNAEDECGNENVGNSCESNDDDCIWNHSNNFMSNGVQTAIVTSQWAQMYGSLLMERPSYLLMEGCAEPSTDPPLEIESNTIETWDFPRYIDTDIEIRTNATLIVECALFMGEEKRIIVNRGGRLFVNGGVIYGLSSDCRWGGILVHGNNTVEQPKPEHARNEYYTLTSNDAGVVWIKDSELRWAQTAISTKGSGTLSTHAYFGGLVMIDNGHFVDNGRAIEFMQYKIPNKSYYNIGNVRLTDSSLDGQGISVWACTDLTFGDVTFEGLKQYAIFGIDFNAIFTDCTFDGTANGTALRSETTHPNSVINNTEMERCTLQNNLNDIVAFSTSSHVNRFTLLNNYFENGIGSPLVGASLRMRGTSTFDCIDNEFNAENRRYVWVQATGSSVNHVSCNVFGDHYYASVLVHGNNSKLLLLGNTFNSTGAKSISLESTPLGITSINSMQGSTSSAAGNCFTTPASAIVANPSNTEKFDYSVYNLSSPETCEKPTNNLSDNGTNNYELLPASREDQFCGAYQSEEVPEYEDKDLTAARSTTATKKEAFESDPTSALKKYEYLLAAAHQDSVLTFLVKKAFAEDDLDKADSLMLSERTDHYTRGVVGLRTQRGDIAGATAALDSIIGETQDDEWFNEIMEINFKIAESDTMYLLTENEENLLNTIAETEESTMSGYACALLSLCAGYSCTLSEGEAESIQASFVGDPIASQIGEELSIYPNPADGRFTFRIKMTDDISGTIKLTNISGQSVFLKDYTLKGVLTEQIEVAEPGFYFLTVLLEGQPVRTEKIVIIK